MKEIDLFVRSGLLYCREILFDSSLSSNSFMLVNICLGSKTTTTSRGDRYLKHTKENISEAILAQLEKKGKLVKSSLCQLTQDQDKNREHTMVKLSTQLNAHQKHPVKLPDIKTETQAVHKEHKQYSDAYYTKSYSNLTRKMKVCQVNKMQLLLLGLGSSGIQKPTEIIV